MAESKRQSRPAANRQASKKSKSSDIAAQSQKILALILSRSNATNPAVSYGEVAKALGVHVCHLKHPMDHLSRALESYAADKSVQIPPLQVLIVNGKTGLPGVGASAHIRAPYVKKGEQYSAVAPSRQKAIIAVIYAAIFRFPDWDKVQRDLAKLLYRAQS